MAVNDDSAIFAALLARTRRSFEAARESAPAMTIERRFRFAGKTVATTIVGGELDAALTEAFRHLERPLDDGAAELRIMTWDAGIAPAPSFFGDLRDHLAAVRPFADGVIARSGCRRYVAWQTPRAVTMIDVMAGEMIGWARSAAELSYFERGKPFQPLLFAWYEQAGVLPIHAALVALGDHGLLFGGSGGSGKSTTSTQCALAGFDFLGDDYVGLSPDGRVAFSFYATAWFYPADPSMARFGHARIGGTQAFEEKYPVSVAAATASRVRDEVVIGSLVLPTIVPATGSRISPITPAEALRRLAASSVLQLPLVAPAQAFARMARLVRTVPCYRLDLGRDADDVPDMLRAIAR